MRRFGLALAAAGVLLGATSGAAAASTGSFLLTAHSSTGSRYAPTFTGNGFLGVRVPVAGEGYASGNVPAQSELAGFYAKPTHPANPSQAVQQRANIPTWSTLLFGDGTDTYGTGGGTLTGWSQSLNLHTGNRYDLGHVACGGRPLGDVLLPGVHRPRGHARGRGVAQVHAPLERDGHGDRRDRRHAGQPQRPGGQGIQRRPAGDLGGGGHSDHRNRCGHLQPADLQPVGLRHPDGGRSDPGPEHRPAAELPGQLGVDLHVHQFVGVDDSQDSPNPVAAAQGEAAKASASGAASLRSANDRSWSGMWQGRVDVLGNRTLATDVNASEFYLWSNTRDGVNWSISPAGLSSNGYDGHIFWDAETWMYPSLLAEHPDLAAGMNNYRFARLGAAKQHATATGYQGARFPWESALDGTEQIPPPPRSTARACTRCTSRRTSPWPSGSTTWSPATELAARAGLAGAVRCGHVLGLQGDPRFGRPLPHRPRDRARRGEPGRQRRGLHPGRRQDHAAGCGQGRPALGMSAPASWSTIARRLAIHTSRVSGVRIYKEFSGYRSQMVKQADVTMLQYPWRYPMRPGWRRTT